MTTNIHQQASLPFLPNDKAEESENCGVVEKWNSETVKGMRSKVPQNFIYLNTIEALKRESMQTVFLAKLSGNEYRK